jgi:CHAT domain
MSARLVARVAAQLNVDDNDVKLQLSLEDPPTDGFVLLDGVGTAAPIVALQNNPPPEGCVRAAGRYLYDWLAARHQLDIELGRADHSRLFLDVRDATAEGVPWEALCAPSGTFLSLDARWPIARMVAAVDEASGVRTFRQPLRIALLLSYLGIKARPEWREIWRALSAWNGKFEVLALVSEPEFGAEIQALTDDRVRVLGLPTTATEVQDVVSAFAPHIVHLFCHGLADNPPFVDLAVTSDWLPGAERSPVQMEARQLGGLSNPQDPSWLIVLNCCEVGGSAGQVHSLARDLVSRGPFAGAVAMREPVEPEDAVIVSGCLYPGLLAAVDEVVAAGGQPTEFDWAELTVKPRIQICERRQQRRTFTITSRSVKQWTLPVLYVRPTPFHRAARRPQQRGGTDVAVAAGAAGREPGRHRAARQHRGGDRLAGVTEWTLPPTLQANAWSGEPVAGGVADATGWSLGGGPLWKPVTPMRPERAPDPADFTDVRVGWGLVLPDRPHLPEADRAGADDAPPALQALLDARAPAARVFRYVPGPATGALSLRDYAAGKDVAISGSPEGIGDGKLPKFLLLYGGPDVLPWGLQYQLNAGRHVGRLDVTGSALDNYVHALIDGFPASRYDAPVVWSVDLGDITEIMRTHIGAKLAARLCADAEMPHARFVDGAASTATIAELQAALVANTRSFAATTSHGMTGPLDEPDRMAATLGLPVDRLHALLDPEALLAQRQPAGTIWYAHACGSAGADASTAFAGLVAADSTVDKVLRGLASVRPPGGAPAGPCSARPARPGPSSGTSNRPSTGRSALRSPASR